VTTVLSMTTLGFGGRSQMPKTSYATALDWFVILCFAFVFASMVEYAAINFMDKMMKDVVTKSKTKKPPGKIKVKDIESCWTCVYRRTLDWFEKELKDPWRYHKKPGSKFSNVDIYSRRIFPLSFTIINTIYWTSFMYYVDDEDDTHKEISHVQN